MSIIHFGTWIIYIHLTGLALCDADVNLSSIFPLNDEPLRLSPTSTLKIFFNSQSASSSPLPTVDGYFLLINNNALSRHGQNDTLTISAIGEESSILASCSLEISDVLSKLAPTTTNLTINWSLKNHNDLNCAVSDHLGNQLSSKSSLIESRPLLNDYHIDIKFSSDGSCIKQFHVCQDPIKFKPDCRNTSSSAFSPKTYFPDKDARTCFSKLQYDPLCCPGCVGNCSHSGLIGVQGAVLSSDAPALLTSPTLSTVGSIQSLADASFPTPPVFPATKFKKNNATKSPRDLAVNAENSSLTIDASSNALSIVNASDLSHLLADHCLPNPCLNNQSCKTVVINESSSSNQLPYQCDCKHPFSGNRCQYIDHCFNNTCKNGATCQSLEPNETKNATKFYRCVCPTGLTGEFCDTPLLFPPLSVTSAPISNITDMEVNNTEASTTHASSISTAERKEVSPIPPQTVILTTPPVSLCVPNPCLHNGTCEIVENANGSLTYKCTCQTEYEGSANCSSRRKTDVAAPVPLPISLATSIDSTTTTTIAISETTSTTTKVAETTPTTSITTAITGTNLFDCSTDSDCHRGKCINEKCNCTGSGYEGLRCEKDINECDLAVCHNQSTCENTPGSYKCDCLPGYSGQHCDISPIIPSGDSSQSHSKDDKTSTSPNHHDDDKGGGGVGGIVGGVIGGIVVLCLIVSGFFLYKYISRSRKLKGKYNPAREEMNNIGGHPVPLATLNTGERLI